ncbi:MAG: S8 family serine peptidase, partial [Rhodothermales bacterium]|nr:S8 family serine peptidase [Rhodothermales bacterium]
HPDLQANVYTNPGEVPDDGIDNDGNGFIDDVRGWNFTDLRSGAPGENGSPDPSSPALTGNLGHGTASSGAAAAVTDNGQGVSGTSWNARLMPIAAGCPTRDNLICFGYSGLLYAALMGADVVNASWGGPGASELEARIVDAVTDDGTLIVASAGNSGTSSDRFPSFPASYDRVLAVGATLKDTQGLCGSNFGRSVSVYAPGCRINVPLPGNAYGTASGTSFSSPLVAGVAALVKTMDPTLTADQLRERLRVTSDSIDDFNPAFAGRLGLGRVNALRAVTETDNPAIRLTDVTFLDDDGNRQLSTGDVATLNLSFVNHLADADGVTVRLGTDDPAVTLVDTDDTVGAIASGGTAQATVSFQVTPPDDDPRQLVLFVEIEDASGYADVAVIRLTANESAFASHATAQLSVSVTDEGNIGYLGFQGESPGSGFVWNGNSLLFEGGLLVATGPERVSDSVRGTSTAQDQHEDFARADDSFLEIVRPGGFTTEQGEVTITDAPAPDPLGVSIYQVSYIDDTPAHDDFMVIRYTITNETDDPIEGFHAGLFLDWDVSQTDPGADFARFDDALGFGYIQNGPSATLAAGAFLLTPEAGSHYRAINNPTEIYRDAVGGGFTETEKFAFLSNGIQSRTLSRTDASQLVGAGPYRLDPGASIDVAFALIGGGSEAALLESARAAQALWDDVLSTVTSADDPEPAPGAFALHAVFPNPFTEAATVGFTLAAPGAVTLEVFDVLGRKVATLLDRPMQAGSHTTAWDGRDHAGRPVAGGVYLVRMAAQGTGGPVQAVRRVVVAR